MHLWVVVLDEVKWESSNIEDRISCYLYLGYSNKLIQHRLTITSIAYKTLSQCDRSTVQTYAGEIVIMRGIGITMRLDSFTPQPRIPRIRFRRLMLVVRKAYWLDIETCTALPRRPDYK